MSEIFLTGAGGFIGSHLCEMLLDEGYKVTALLRYTSSGNPGWLASSLPHPRLKVVNADIADQRFLEAHINSDTIVINLAALIGIPYSYEAPSSYINTNILGLNSLLQASINKNAKHLIQTSTSEIYGTAQYTPIDEKHPHVGQSPYSATKIAADQLALSFYRAYGFPVTVVRPFNTYGPRQSPRAFIPSVICQILDSESTSIKVGSLHPTRDFNFVRDTAQGFISVIQNLDKCTGLEINIASNFTVSMQSVVDLLLDLSGSQHVIETDEQRIRPEKSEVDILYGCNKLITKLTGWRPLYAGEQGFAKGLEETYLWYKSYCDQNQTTSNRYFV